jgi:dUTP pyrophosphatase
MKVKISRTDNTSAIQLPTYQTDGSAGMDICANIEGTQIIKAGEVALIPTGISISLPDGYECQVRSRSGLAARNGIFALNAPGTIDSDYRGEIKIILANFSKVDYGINNGDRVAQLVIAKYEKITWEEVDILDGTNRGSGGFGSTGIL